MIENIIYISVVLFFLYASINYFVKSWKGQAEVPTPVLILVFSMILAGWADTDIGRFKEAEIQRSGTSYIFDFKFPSNLLRSNPVILNLNGDELKYEKGGSVDNKKIYQDAVIAIKVFEEKERLLNLKKEFKK